MGSGSGWIRYIFDPEELNQITREAWDLAKSHVGLEVTCSSATLCLTGVGQSVVVGIVWSNLVTSAC